MSSIQFDIALVETARNGYMWEALGYNSLGNEIGERFDTEAEAYAWVENYKVDE
jgi:hypothetical protein